MHRLTSLNPAKSTLSTEPASDRCFACRLGQAARPGDCPFHDTSRKAGSILIQQGEVPKRVWFVREGTVLLTSVSPGGNETFCSLRRAGSMLGLEAACSRPADYQAWALSEVELCGIGLEAFQNWLGSLDSPMGAILNYALSESSERREERLAMTGRSVSRIARFLIERHRLEGNDRPLAVQQQILARMLGMRAETLSRALRKLRSEGAIARGRRVKVIDPVVLAQLAGD